MKSLLLTVLLSLALASNHIVPVVGEIKEDQLEPFSVVADETCEISGVETFFSNTGNLCHVKLIFLSTCEPRTIETGSSTCNLKKPNGSSAGVLHMIPH